MSEETTLTLPLAEAEKPAMILSGMNSVPYLSHVAVPPGWALKSLDDIDKADQPRRKAGNVSLSDLDSFIAYIDKHSDASISSVYCDADFQRGKVLFQAVLNDHGSDEMNWRDFYATFEPRKAVEWARWTGKDREPFAQADFAAWIEDNMKDIVGVDGSPTGAQMLEMAINMESTQDVRFKSAVRLQNGGVQLSFVQDDDAQTLARMELFKGFSIGIPVFWNGDSFRVDARLRYRIKEGKLLFWYELIRPDKILEAAAKEIVEAVKLGTAIPFYYGKAFG